eukprot:2911504-Amphidinium_carterae.1
MQAVRQRLKHRACADAIGWTQLMCHVPGPGARAGGAGHHGTPTTVQHGPHEQSLVECFAVVAAHSSLQKRQGQHTPHCSCQ